MVTEFADCAANKLLCESFMGGSLYPFLSRTCQEYGTLPPPTLAPTEEQSFIDYGFSNEPQPIFEAACDQTLISDPVRRCPSLASEKSMIFSFNGQNSECGDALTLEEASVPPSISVVPGRIDPDALFSLVMVDTSSKGNSSVHSILHFGAVNIPGSALVSGFSLGGTLNETTSEEEVFSQYRGPSPPRPNTAWAPPRVDKTLFVYEIMVGLQADGEILAPEPESNLNFDYVDFFLSEVGIKSGMVASSNFYSGWCAQGQDAQSSEEQTGDWTCSSENKTTGDEIIIESFVNPSFVWITMNDPMLGGSSYSTFSIEDDSANFRGEVNNVPLLGSPGFIRMEARGKGFPDVSCCEALKLVVKSTEDYEGYFVSFGTKAATKGFFATGFKAPFRAPVGGTFGEVIIPFEDFSVEWDEVTGYALMTCSEDKGVCPDDTTLQNMETIAIWGQGIGGVVNLEVQSISTVGCAPPLDASALDVQEDSSSGGSSCIMGTSMILLCTVVFASIASLPLF